MYFQKKWIFYEIEKKYEIIILFFFKNPSCHGEEPLIMNVFWPQAWQQKHTADY